MLRITRAGHDQFVNKHCNETNPMVQKRVRTGRRMAMDGYLSETTYKAKYDGRQASKSKHTIIEGGGNI